MLLKERISPDWAPRFWVSIKRECLGIWEIGFFVVKAAVAFIGDKFSAFSKELVPYSTLFFCSLMFLSSLWLIFWISNINITEYYLCFSLVGIFTDFQVEDPNLSKRVSLKLSGWIGDFDLVVVCMHDFNVVLDMEFLLQHKVIPKPTGSLSSSNKQ